MGTLAIDIETASPDEEPRGKFENTEYFELVAVALGFRQDAESAVKSEVLFRDGGWEREHTAELLDRMVDWVANYEIESVLTYNGTGFDFIHLLNWSEEADNDGVSNSILRQVEALDSNQIDLKYPSIEHHSDLMKQGHDFPKLEKVCAARSIPTAETRYDDYDINANFLQSMDLTAETVEGWHIGKYLGERYVEGVVNGLQDTLTYRELEAMLSDYAEADIQPLFDLYDSFDDSDCRQVSCRGQQVP